MLFGKHINRYYKKHAALLLLGLISLVAVDYLQLIIPNLYQMVINGMTYGFVTADGKSIPFDTTFLLDKICYPMILIILLMVFGRFLWRICFFGTAIGVEADLRSRMFDRSRTLSQEYYQRNKVGNLMSLYTNDLDTVQECFGWGIMMLMDAVLMGALAILKMLQMDPFLTLLSMVPMALLLACATLVGRYMTRKWDERQQAFSDLSDFSQESFSGIAVIKAFVKEATELMAFRKLNQQNEKANMAHTRASVLLRILVTLFVESVICIILGYGGYLVYSKRFNAGQLVEFIGYFNAVIWPIMAVSELIDMSSRGRASLKRIGELLDAPIDVTDRETVDELSPVQGAITVKNLTFCYPGGEYNALENVSFRISPGEHIGLVGKTGCGKTTLVDLLLRTYNVPDGTVFIDGQDVNSVSIRSVRENCAYVPQDNFLFSDTIGNNIAFACDFQDPQIITEAAVLADIHHNITQFSKGYETVLGERGVTVSGGQKQRISIARALMKNAPILILDDSVSAVDTKTEQAILSSLKTTRQGKTTLLIAHRISTVQTMDRILFMSDGKISGFDTHEALYKANASYRKMVDLQKLEEVEGNA